MNAKDVLRHSLTSTRNILEQYVSDLSDADLLVRPVPGANHIAWQLGHLIAAEVGMMTAQFPQGDFPELPAGFKEAHDKSTASSDSAKGFLAKDQYLNLFRKVRKATLTAVDKLSEADLDKPTVGNMKSYAPNLGEILVLQANHVMMHAGQFTVVRRKLGKPVLF